jgi:DNA-binding Xre family transcriptional regulator
MTTESVESVMPMKWRLKEFMRANNITQKALEEVSGVPQSQISRLPGVSRAEFKTLLKLLPALEILAGKSVALSDILEYVKDEAQS